MKIKSCLIVFLLFFLFSLVSCVIDNDNVLLLSAMNYQVHFVTLPFHNAPPSLANRPIFLCLMRSLILIADNNYILLLRLQQLYMVMVLLFND